MPLTGSQKAYKQARSGIARSGASRSGYYTPNMVITINGVDRTSKVIIKSLRIHQGFGDDPDTASFSIKPESGFVPTMSHAVIIGLGTAANAEFAGQIAKIRHRRDRASHNWSLPYFDITCQDYQRLFNRRLVTKYWTSTAANTIVTDIVSLYTSGFTTHFVQTGLPTIAEFACTQEAPMTALRRLVRLLGGDSGCYLDTNHDVHFYGSSGETSTDAPTRPVSLSTSLATLESVQYLQDDMQRRTRVNVKGNTVSLLTDVAAGQVLIPVESTEFYDNDLFLTYTIEIAEYGIIAPVGITLSTSIESANLVSDATAGATSVTVADASALTNTTSWYHEAASDTYFYSTGRTITGPGNQGTLDGIPASGPGSIPTTLYGPEWWVSRVPSFTVPALTRDLNRGTSIALYVTRDDTTEQTALATAEGGDGIHETVIQDERLSPAGAVARGDADLAIFAPSLTELEWDTFDLNARPGRLQAFNFNLGTENLVGNLTILSADVEFFDRPRPPRRICRAGLVRVLNADGGTA